MFHRSTSNGNWFDLSIGVYFGLAILAALLGASSQGRAALLEGIHRVDALISRPAPVVQTARRVLIVTASERVRRNVVTTASARGFESKLASTAAQAREILAAHAGAIDLVVMDSSVMGASALPAAVPTVVIRPDMGADAIAPLLLARM